MFFFSGELQSFWLINNKNLFVCVLIPSEKKQKKHTHTNKAEFGEWILSFWLVVPLGSDKTWKDFHMEKSSSDTPWYRKIIEPQPSLPSGSIRSSLGGDVFFLPPKNVLRGLAHGFCIQVCRPSQKTTWQRQSWGTPPNAPKPCRSDPGGGKGGNIFSSSLVLYMHRKFQRVDTRVRKWKNGEIYNIHPNKLANKQKISDWVNLFIIIFPYNLAQLASGMPCLESFHFIYFPLFEYESYQEWILSIFGSRN